MDNMQQSNLDIEVISWNVRGMTKLAKLKQVLNRINT